jgi:hypothetical protein
MKVCPVSSLMRLLRLILSMPASEIGGEARLNSAIFISTLFFGTLFTIGWV